VLVWGAAATLAFSKRTTIPEQPFEIQQRLREGAVTRLMHADDAIHAFHNTAGTHRPQQNSTNPTVQLAPIRIDPIADNSLNNMCAMCYRTSTARPLVSTALTTEPPKPYQGFSQFLVRFRLAQLVMQSIQKRQRTRIGQHATCLCPLQAVQLTDGHRDFHLSPSSVV
jgi:hypothetical protein